MPFVQDNDVAEQIAAYGLDPSFRHAVLPRAARGDLPAPNRHVLDHGKGVGLVLLAVVEDQVSRDGIDGKRPAKRLDNPPRVGFSAAIRRAKARIAASVEGRPTGRRPWPEVARHDPEEPIGRPRPRSGSLGRRNGELRAEGQILDQKGGPRRGEASEPIQDSGDSGEHRQRRRRPARR